MQIKYLCVLSTSELMVRLALVFAILFLKVPNIDFPLILIFLNVVERSLLL